VTLVCCNQHLSSTSDCLLQPPSTSMSARQGNKTNTKRKNASNFQFGEQIEVDIPSTKASKRSTKGRKRRKLNSDSGSKAEYGSFHYNDVQYHKGDDVVVAMPDQEGGWAVARITKISAVKKGTEPLIEVIWFWRATELTGSKVKAGIQYHQLHLDEHCPGEIALENLFEKTLSSKALVVSSSEEYVQSVKAGVDTGEYHDVYWCARAYNQNTEKYSPMPTQNTMAIRGRKTGKGAGSFTHNDIEYKLGDDVVVDMTGSDGGWGVARITEITPCAADTNPSVQVIWFWRASELSGLKLKKTTRGSTEDVKYHELLLDEHCPGEITLDNLLEKKMSSKALVVSSLKDYVSRIQTGVDPKEYFDVYWCTHAYNQNTNEKSEMPIAVSTEEDSIDDEQLDRLVPSIESLMQDNADLRDVVKRKDEEIVKLQKEIGDLKKALQKTNEQAASGK